MYGENTKYHGNPYIQGTTVPLLDLDCSRLLNTLSNVGHVQIGECTNFTQQILGRFITYSDSKWLLATFIRYRKPCFNVRASVRRLLNDLSEGFVAKTWIVVDPNEVM